MRDRTVADECLDYLLWLYEWTSQRSARQFLRDNSMWEEEVRVRERMRSMKRRGWIEVRHEGPEPVVVLTDAGRQAACGGVDPETRWSRPWDGQWRFFVFDVPGRQPRIRMSLWRWMRQERFGYLQNSVWITPDPVDAESVPIRALRRKAESYTFVQGRPVPPDDDQSLVSGAWDIPAIDRAHGEVLRLADEGAEALNRRGWKPSQRREWAASLRRAWRTAQQLDPLLPEALWPEGYRGRMAWRARREVLNHLAARGPRLG